MAASRSSVSVSRSTIPGAVPAATARSTSRALAARISAVAAQGVGHREQRGVLLRPRQLPQRDGGLLGPAGRRQDELPLSGDGESRRRGVGEASDMAQG